MWRTLTGEGSGGSGASATSVPGGELTSAGIHSHDSPLLGLLSTVSRPAASFLQRYLPPPGRAVKREFLGQNSEFVGPFDDILPPSQLHSLPWVSLQELGIQQPEMSFQTGYSTPVSTVLVSPPTGGSKTWWGSFWSSEDDQRRLKVVNGGLLCAESNRTSVFVSGERPGAALDKSLYIGNTIPQLTLIQSLTVLTPDQDNGYSSLEEEQLLVAKAQLQGALPGMVTEEAAEEEQETEENVEEEELPVLKCDNKAIAFIMGCPCSDDSQSESSSEEEEESEAEEEDDDDGFDSECSSEISDSDEFDSETERLWSALCQNNDPYNPRNFTANIKSAPKPIPKPGLGSGPGLEEAQCSPVSSVSSSVSSSCSSSSWDEASESEEQENLRLLGSFCSSDPYSPLNFQAPIRTKPGFKPGSEPSSSGPVCEVEEEQRERNESEPTRPESRTRATSHTKKKKKVRFCDDVQFFFVGCEERRSPWEEFARDRARFSRRCLEIEEAIGYCLSPAHRGLVYSRNYSCSPGHREQDGQSEGQEVQTCQSETEERPSS